MQDEAHEELVRELEMSARAAGEKLCALLAERSDPGRPIVPEP